LKKKQLVLLILASQKREAKIDAQDRTERYRMTQCCPALPLQGWIVACGTPYASYCSANGMLSKNHGVSLMQPYYFRFVRRQDDIRVGYFDYRPRNEQEAVVSAISTDWGASWARFLMARDILTPQQAVSTP
jgi:hypothetical protein